jgi:hypothetical protein
VSGIGSSTLLQEDPGPSGPQIELRSPRFSYFFSGALRPHSRGGGRISRSTRPHSKNANFGNCLFLNFDTKFGFKSIELVKWNSNLIKKVTNRGKFLFTFPHPSPKGTSVLIDYLCGMENQLVESSP